MNRKRNQLQAVGLMALCVVWGFVGCHQEPDDGDTSRQTTSGHSPVVVCANYPLYEFASRIGGEFVDVRFIVPPETDPALWHPGSTDIELLQQADKIILNGAGYEHWLPTVSLSEKSLVDTSRGFRGQFIDEEQGVTHQHGPDGEHLHGGVAFTTWLDFSLAIEQATAVEQALSKLLAGKDEIFSKNLDDLVGELSNLDKGFLEWGDELDGKPLIASHPVYQYFAKRYSLNLKSVHWEPHVVPGASELAELEEMLRDHPATWMIWESDPAPESVRLLRARGIESVVIDPSGNAPDKGGFLETMEANIGRAQMMLK